MNFEIEVATYIRLAGVTDFIRPEISENEKQHLRCVRLERNKGHTFALASNKKIGAVYYLGKTEGADGAIHMTVDAALLKQCATEKPFNSKIHIVGVPEIGVCSGKTTLGYSHPGNIGTFPQNSPLDTWREWARHDPIAASSGAMHWYLPDVQALNSASPSGHVLFPEFIDANKPVLLRDENDPNWCGFFMVNVLNEQGQPYQVEPAELPKWWK